MTGIQRPRRRIVICVAWLALAVASPAAQAEILLHPCVPARSKTLASDGQARVYSIPLASEGHALSAEGHASAFQRPVDVFGCLLATERLIRLGTTFIGADAPTIDPRTIALSGPWVAYSLTVHGTDGNTVSVALRNLEAGNVKRQAGAEPGPLGPEHFSTVTKIGVNKAGAFAWISTGSSIGGGRAREVAAVDTNGKVVVFDTAADIDLRSLTLDGRKLSWTDGGIGHSATLR